MVIEENDMKKQRQGGFLMSKIHHLSGRIFKRMLKEHGIDEINPAQGRIMFVLWSNDGISIHDLAKKTSLGKSTLTSMLDRLEKNGFLRREPSKEDRRKILIWRTEKDKSFQKLYVEISREMTEIYYEGFSQEERDRFEAFLKRLHENLKRYE
ncbi:MarR family transcriptional regulator [bacterium]|nr:MarR family transcriptional regulator [bacterium]